MAMARFLALMFLAMFAISMLQSTMVMARGNASRVQRYQCPSRCAGRCSKKDHDHEACMFFCQKCCTKCLCVPPGTYGNKAMCSCYNSWKTKQGGPKCP
ncbi:Gibberellin-regulated protein 6 [Ranunculus cassubicifolius]